jgi:uncharacterized protein YdcH (DUF465 family)
MELHEEALIHSLMETNSELRQRYNEHVALNQQSDELKLKPHLTEEEEIELKRIQKQKLAGKDRIMEILSRHRQPAA